MFTGLIEELGIVANVEEISGGKRITVTAPLVESDVALGDSIAVNGVCLTVIARESGLCFDVSRETLSVSTLASLSKDSRVNLERAVTPSTRMGGHFVQGHVDANGEFLDAATEGDFWRVRIGFPPEFGRYLIYKGSIAVDGISLTVAKLAENHAEIAVIPKTWEMTNLSTLAAGDPVNLEADMIAKYVEKLVAT